MVDLHSHDKCDVPTPYGGRFGFRSWVHTMNMRVSPVICDSEAYSGVYLQLPSKSGKRREGKVSRGRGGSTCFAGGVRFIICKTMLF